MPVSRLGATTNDNSIMQQDMGGDMARKLAAGNWKMNGTGDNLAELEALAEADLPQGVEVLICPPLRVEQPNPGSPASTTSVSRPPDAVTCAALSPV